MLFNFNHRDKMVGQSIDAAKELSNNEPLTVTLTTNLAANLHFEPGDTLLVLAVTPTKSVLTKTQPVTGEHGYDWRLDKSDIQYLDSSADSITFWSTNLSKIDKIDVNSLSMDTDLIVGTNTDPTGGTDLFIRTFEHRYRNNKNSFDGQFRIPADPHRKWLNINEDDSITFKVSRADKSNTPTTETTRPIVSNGKKATITAETRNKVDVDADHREITIWATTESIAEEQEQTQENDEQITESESSRNESHLAEIAATTTDSTTTTQSETDTDTQQQPTTETQPQTNGSAASTSSSVSSPQPENTDNTTTTSDSETDPNEADNTSPEEIKSDRSVSESLLGDTEITPEVNPDLTPVVLLDADERTEKHWKGHYQKENGKLLCEKEYTEAIPDPERNHYSKICLECLQTRPGALTNEDITAIFEKITGSKFTTEMPIMLDRKKAAEVVAVVAPILSNKSD